MVGEDELLADGAVAHCHLSAAILTGNGDDEDWEEKGQHCLCLEALDYCHVHPLPSETYIAMLLSGVPQKSGSAGHRLRSAFHLKNHQASLQGIIFFVRKYYLW